MKITHIWVQQKLYMILMYMTEKIVIFHIPFLKVMQKSGLKKA